MGSHPPRSKRSAGLLLYRRRAGALEVLLAHPGGPFWAKKDLGAWTIPKGGVVPGEEPLAAAKREFQEETGLAPDTEVTFREIGEIKQAGGKRVTAWAFEGDFDPTKLVSNSSQMEWPPRSGRLIEIPEIDRAAWFSIEGARARLLPSQLPFLDRLLALLGRDAQPG